MRTKSSLFRKSNLSLKNKKTDKIPKMQMDKCDSILPNVDYFRPSKRSKHLMETFILEVLFVCKSVLRRNTKKIYGTEKKKKKRRPSSEELKCTAGQHLYCQRSEHNEGRFVVAKFRCEIPDMSDHIPALVRYFSDPELEAPTDLVTSEVTHNSFRATWTAPAGPVDKYRVTYVQVAGGPTLEVR